MKFLVAHELGHYLLGRKLGVEYVPYLDYDAPHGACGGAANHEMPQVEWQPAAFWEGFAHFYAATVFNNTGQSDCFMQYYGAENYDEDQDNEPRTTNCAGVPWEDASGNLMHAEDASNDPAVDEDDYFGDMLELDCGYDGYFVNVSTEYDWARFLWAMNQEGMTVAQIADVVALADPVDWLTGVGSDDPFEDQAFTAVRLLDAVEVYDLTHSPDWGPTWDTLGSVHGVYQ